MAGKLTIHSSGTGKLLSGHSWIEYTPDGGSTTTYGTWGNNPTGKGNGLFENLELGVSSDASRSMRITDEQEKKLFEKIKEYKDKGEDGWGYLSPCSAFATDTWETTTGEKLEDRSYGIISNPSKLKESITHANNKTTQSGNKTTPERPKSSRKKCQDPIQPCPKGNQNKSSGGSS